MGSSASSFHADPLINLLASLPQEAGKSLRSSFVFREHQQQQAAMEEDTGAAGGPSKYVKLIR